MYGDFENVCKAFNHSSVAVVCANPIKAVSADAPSFARLNVTYGVGAARQWLFLILQSSVKMLGVDSTRMGDAQIIHLADIISGTYPHLTLTEFLLFISRFEAGMYERFYGDTSYFLAITKSLSSFMSDRRFLLDLAEKEHQRKWRQEQENRKDTMSYVDFVRNTVYKEKENILRQAEAVSVHNRMNPVKAQEADEAFKANYGITPKEYIEKYKDNDKV